MNNTGVKIRGTELDSHGHPILHKID